jgi:hypothetical protein
MEAHMPWTIIVASGDGDQLDELINGAQEIAKTIADSTIVVSADSVEEVKKRRTSATGRNHNQLLIVSASIPDEASHEPHAAWGLELIRSIAQQPDAPHCILVSDDINHLSPVQEIARCELLYVGSETSYIQDCLRLARKLGVVPAATVPPGGGAPAAASPSVTAPDARDSGLDDASRYALIEVHMFKDAHGFVTLAGSPPQPIDLNQNHLDELIKESQTLAERINKARGQKEDWQRYLREWRAEYQRLGERVGNLLWPTAFSPLYWGGYTATSGNIRLRFNLDQSYFDGAWEAIYDNILRKNFVMLGDTVTVARRSNHFDLRNVFASGKSDSAPAQIDATKGVLKVVVIESNVPDQSAPEGPSDPLWEKYWSSLKGTLPTLPHVKKEVETLRRLVRARSRTDKAGHPQPRVEVEVLSPRVGKPLAEIVECRLKDRTRHYDIVHFAGHALFARSLMPQDRRGYLVFSGEPGGRPRAVPIATVAEWLNESGVQLVYLSCCRSSSAAAATELAARNVPLTIGFNWDLDDEKALEFARDFYTELLDGQFQVCKAFGKARRNLHGTFDGSDPIWASPVLIAQPDEWTQVECMLHPLATRPRDSKKAPRNPSVRRRPPAVAPPAQTPRAA